MNLQDYLANKCSVETLAKWSCELNCWRWPDDFPRPKPEGFDYLNMDAKYHLPEFRQAVDALKSLLSEKQISRAWHMEGYTGRKKTEEEFETWWNSVFHGH